MLGAVLHKSWLTQSTKHQSKGLQPTHIADPFHIQMFIDYSGNQTFQTILINPVYANGHYYNEEKHLFYKANIYLLI